MKIDLRSTLILIASIFVLTTAIGQTTKRKNQNSILLSIGNENIYTTEFIDVFKTNHSLPSDYTEAKILDYLDLFVKYRLKVKAAKAEGMDTTREFTNEFNSYKLEFKKSFLGQKEGQQRLVKEAYNHLLEAVKGSHILIELPPNSTPKDTLEAFQKISSLNSRILEGESFEVAYEQVLNDEDIKTKVGNMGFFTAFQNEYPIEKAVFQLKVGQVSPPIRTQFGYHLIKVIDRIANPGRISISQIFLPHSNSEDQNEIEKRIFEVYNKAIEPNNWEKVKFEYSKDNQLSEFGNHQLNNFGVGEMTLIPELEKIALTLENEKDISKPFRSNLGWHIIRLENRTFIPPFNKIERILQQKVINDSRIELVNQEMLREKKNTYQFVENADAMQWYLQIRDSSNSNLEQIGKQPLFQVQGKGYFVRDFIDFLEKDKAGNKILSNQHLIRLYNQFVMHELDEVEENTLFNENKEFRRVISEYRNGIMLFNVMEKNVWNRVGQDSVAMKRFFDDNISNYQAKERIRARIFVTTDSAVYSYIQNKINTKDSLTQTDLKKFKSIIPFRNYERGENKIIDQISWVVGIKYFQDDNNYYVLEVTTLLPAGSKTFEEAKIQVVGDYQKKLEKDWLNDLRIKYPVKLNKHQKKLVLKQLRNK